MARAGLIIFGMVVSLVLVETGVRLAYPFLPPAFQGIVRHVRIWGVQGQSLGPTWFESCTGDDRLGARIQPDLDRQRVQFGPALYHVSTDSLGFGAVGFRTGGMERPFDAVAVGDSFTFCHHVDYDDCWVHHLSRSTGLRIANLGVPATGSVSHARYLENFGRKLAPKLVLWQYWTNDPQDDVEQVITGMVPCPREESRHVSANQDESIRELLKNGSIAANLLHHLWSQSVPPVSFEARRTYQIVTTKGRKLLLWRNTITATFEAAVARSGFAMTTAAIGTAARRTAAKGGQFLLIVAPSNLQTYANELPTAALRAKAEAEDRTSDALIRFAEDNGIACVDLRPAFIAAAELGEDLYPDYDVHWTPAGNRLAARLVGDRLGKPPFN